MARSRPIVQATLDLPAAGVIELESDWRAKSPPPFALCRGEACSILATLAAVPGYAFGFESGYFVNDDDEVVFVLRTSRLPELDPLSQAIYLSGDFNGWSSAVGQAEWALHSGRIGGENVLYWTGPVSRFPNQQRFKFVTGAYHWLPVPNTAPNVVRDDNGNTNHLFDPQKTGRHLYAFTLAAPLDLSAAWTIGWESESAHVPLRPGAFFYEMKTDHALGALVNGDETTFRLFAPRAVKVELELFGTLDDREVPHRYELTRLPEADASWGGAWAVTLEQNLHGWYYQYHIEGAPGAFGFMNSTLPILDPYAYATVGRDGPGIVIDRAWLGSGDRNFRTPSWHDLVIAEAHVRDLSAHAPVLAEPEERLGFAGLTRWVESPDFHLHRLGVNAVELQPVQEFDNKTRAEYHWGYMTNNYFSPETSYSLAPEKASGVRELQTLVAALHKRGIAVIIDVVYNHVGEPAHLMLIDQLYYFEMDRFGALSNWSGCGNDVRCGAAMSRRLIIDSLVHLIEIYGIDGFRFDLAELIGVTGLREIERALKQVKPDVILIAEPWSFRGHIAAELRDTGYASWNDGYRNFLRDFVRGGSSRADFEYYVKGSPWHFARWPAQTVNYTESHDDRTWLDTITENPDNNGSTPTFNDRRRTHLMAAILFASIGIPMLAAGQDFLRSKQGVNNTYQRGDLNALDYRRIYRFHGTHAYFADWIAFRRSEAGRLLRHFSRASETFFRFFGTDGTTATAVLYNADRSQGGTRLLFAVNPTLVDSILPIDAESVAGHWRQIADVDRFYGSSSHGTPQPVESELFVPALGCGLWISKA